MKVFLFCVVTLFVGRSLPFPWTIFQDPRCFQEIVKTSGSYMGLEIGGSKREVFERILELYRKGSIQGFGGMEDRPRGTPLRRYEWNILSSENELKRLSLFSYWGLYSAQNTHVADVALSGRSIVGINTYDKAGRLIEHAQSWTVDDGTLRALLPVRGDLATLYDGMPVQAAIEILTDLLRRGLLARVAATERDIAGPEVYDETAFSYLEPWNKWELSPLDFGGIWLSFSDGRLGKIHHRIQCVELP